MVDAPDLGSGGDYPREGSNPSSRILFLNCEKSFQGISRNFIPILPAFCRQFSGNLKRFLPKPKPRRCPFLHRFTKSINFLRVKIVNITICSVLFTLAFYSPDTNFLGLF